MSIKTVKHVSLVVGAAMSLAVFSNVQAGGDPASTYNSVCAACHNTGAAGAPKVGNKGDWAPRIAKGKDSLYTVALKGKGAMPPKGGRSSLSDDEVKAIVDYMVEKSQ